MVAARTNGPTTTGPAISIPDSALYTATPAWQGDVHSVHYAPTQPRPDAQPLLLVHGACHNGLCWSLGPDHWVRFFTQRGHHVYALSLPGHRPSRGRVRFQSLKRYLDAIQAVITAAGLAEEHLVLIAHSMGGVLGQAYLAQHPALAGVVVVDNPTIPRTLDAYLASFRGYARQHPLVALRAFLNTRVLFATPQRVRALLVGAEADDTLVAALLRQIGGETMLGVLQMMKLGKTPLALPVEKLLFLVAEDSALYAAEVTKASAAEVGAKWVAVPGGHNVMMTRAGARPGAEAIEAFLASLPARAAHAAAGGDAW